MPDEELPEPADSCTPVAPSEDVGYTDRGVPTFDAVREKIEHRVGAAQGEHELALEQQEREESRSPATATAPTDAPDSFTPAPVATSAPADTGYTERGVPTFDAVREKIETRYGTALGAHELAADTPEGRAAEEQYEARQKAAAERLDEIRKSMHAETEEGKA